MTYDQAQQVSAEELRRNKRRCWWPPCHRTAFLLDWAGWKWCPYHWYRSLRWGSGENNRWFYIRNTKFF